MRYSISFLIILSCLSSCSKSEAPPSSNWQEIAGRDAYADSTSRFPVYHVKIPLDWKRTDPTDSESLTDTTKALVTFNIQEEGKEIRITIHNFPTQSLDQRIPPLAQIARWKKQFEMLDIPSVSIQPQAFGGFSGYVFEGQGLLKGKETAMMGWTMQLASDHFRALSYPNHAKEQALYRQMQADYTIKIMGDPQLVSKHKTELVTFARSFELIHDIPN